MTQAAKAQEPSMEEILASIRRIIADDDARSLRPRPRRRPEPPRRQGGAATASEACTGAAAAPAAMKQDDIDAMLAGLDEPPKPAPPKAVRPSRSPSRTCSS